MKILILYRHFWPDSPPYASMLRSIARTLVEAGHEVTIWAEEPCYKPSDRRHAVPRRTSIDGIKVERLRHLPDGFVTEPMRLLDKLLFVPRLLFKAIIRRVRGADYDLVWTATIPPVIQGWAGRTIARLFGARFLYHCQDLYPELAGHMGLWRRDGVLYNFMMRIERKTRRQADLLVTLSEDMAATIRAHTEPRKLMVINNFQLEDFSPANAAAAQPVAAASRRDDGKIQLIFAGNMGIFQGLEAVVEAMRLIETQFPALELILMGEGKALPKLKRISAGLSNVRFEPHRPYEEAQSVIASADIGLVSLEPGVQRYAFPSKTLTYAGLGLRVFAIIDADSELSKMVLGKDLGWVSRGRDSEGIAQTLLLVSQASFDLPYRPERAMLSREGALQCWERALTTLWPDSGSREGSLKHYNVVRNG